MPYPKKTPEVIARSGSDPQWPQCCAGLAAEGMRQRRRLSTDGDPEFAVAYEKAKEERGNYYGELVAEISLAGLQGKYKDSAMLRAAIDGLKWSAARMAPKGFGDRMQVEHSAESSYVDALRAVQGKVSGECGEGTIAQPLALRARETAKKPTVQ